MAYVHMPRRKEFARARPLQANQQEFELVLKEKNPETFSRRT
jgi:hypothetical protein